MKNLFCVLVLICICASEGLAQLPAGLKFDDGFTWFECKNYETYPDNQPVGEWIPVISTRVIGEVPQRSGWKYVIKKGDKKLAEYLADGFDFFRLGKKTGMVMVGFWKDNGQRIREDGMLDFEVYYIDGKTDKEYLAKTLKVDVRKVATERGSVGQRDPGCEQFYVNRHADVLSSILYFRDVEDRSYTLMASEYYSERVVELVVNYAENEHNDSPALGRLRVEVDGKEIEMMVPNNTVMQDEMSMGQLAGKGMAVHSDRAAEKYFKSGPKYQERIAFVRRVFILPVHWGPKERIPSKINASEHPGEWKITWVIDRKPVRVFHFKVGKDGRPVPHPEQAKGLTLLDGAILVDTEIPKEGAPFEGRLTNEFVKQGAFFGRPWETDVMKKAAEAVPSKGTAFPVPSDKQ